jgi:hypothetical protein
MEVVMGIKEFEKWFAVFASKVSNGRVAPQPFALQHF